MVRTPSTMTELGRVAPPFRLQNAVDGRWVSLDDFQGAKALLVVFMCNHCPYVMHIADSLAKLGQDYRVNAWQTGQGLAMVGINANDIAAHPDDSPDKMRAEAQARGYLFPYLFDPTQDVAKAYHAACTPDFFLFDASMRLVYRGQFDASRPKSDIPVTGEDLRAAIDAVLAGKTIAPEQQPSLGCNIKWKTGNAPAYFA